MLCSSSPTMPCSVYAGLRFILTASFWHCIQLVGENGKLVRFISVSVSLKATCVLHSLTLHPSDIILKYKHFFLPSDMSIVKTTDNNDNNFKMLKKRLYSESKHIIKQEVTISYFQMSPEGSSWALIQSCYNQNKNISSQTATLLFFLLHTTFPEFLANMSLRPP